MDSTTYNPFPLPPEEIAARAVALYERRLRNTLDTAANTGKFVSIDIESGEHALGVSHWEASRLKTERPDAVVYTLRIGYPAAVSLSGRLRPSATTP